MRNLRRWQILLGTLLLIGLFDVLYMLVDLEGAMELRGEMMHLMTDGEGVEGTMRVADLIPAMVLTFFTLVLGGLLVWRGLHLRSAQALLAFIIIFNLPAFTLFKLGLPVEMLFQTSMVLNVAWMLPLVMFAAVFPRRLTKEDLLVVRKSGGRIRRVLGSPFRWLRSAMLEPGAAMVAVVIVLVLSAWPGGLLPFLFLLLSMWLAASYLRAGFLVADEEGRRRVLWIVNGFSGAFWLMLIGGIGMILVSVSVGISHGIAHELGHEADDLLIPYWIMLGVECVYILAMLIILVSIVAAILYRGAMDPGLVLRKTTVYGALGVCLAFLFAILENVLSSQVEVRFGMPGATGGWLAGGLTALAIGPLHHRIKRRSDKFINRLLPARPGDSADESVMLLVELEGHARLSSDNPDAAGTAASLLQKVAQRAANRFGGRVRKLSDGCIELEVSDTSQAKSVANFAEDAYAAAAEMMELPPLKVMTQIRDQANGAVC
jgi:hypothetical protein